MNLSKWYTRIVFILGAVLLLAYFMFDVPVLGLLACIMIIAGHISSLLSTHAEAKAKRSHKRSN